MLGRPNELSRGLAQSVIQPTGFFFEVFLAVVCSNNGAIGGPPTWPPLIKKPVFEISKRAILTGKYALSPRYHTEPDSTRTLNAPQIRQTPTRPHTSDVRVLLREHQLEMGLLVARDSSSAFFRNKKKQWACSSLLMCHIKGYSISSISQKVWSCWNPNPLYTLEKKKP